MKNQEQRDKIRIDFLEEQFEMKNQEEENYKFSVKREFQVSTKKLSEKIKTFEEQVSLLRLERDSLKEEVSALQEN